MEPLPIDSAPETPPSGLPEDATLTFDPAHSAFLAEIDEDESLGATRNLPGAEKTPPPPEIIGAQRDSSAPGGGAAFALQQLVGRGGFGEIWQAQQRSLGRIIAVKQLRESLYRRTESPQELLELERLFRVEALTTSRLEHPNIVPVYEMGRDSRGRPQIGMKLVRGQPWNEAIRDDAPALSTSDFLTRHLPVLIQVGQAVAFAHSRGIVHRDLKPGQVMLGEYGEVLLMDWGLAVCVGSPEPEREAAIAGILGDLPNRESASSPSGTPAYMAPEQTQRSAARIGPWTDVFLLGAILYELLTGTPPHHAASSKLAFAMAIRGDVTPPSVRTPTREIPAELADIAMKALARDPEDRIASARDFVGALQNYLSGVSRRSESRAICNAVAKQLDNPAGGYALYSEAIASLGKAAALWPENEIARSLLQLAHSLFARAALKGNDLTLARVEGGRIESPAERAQLLDEVESRERQLESQGRQRRIAIGLSAALLAVLLAGGAKYIYDQRQSRLALQSANARLQKQYDRASAAREDAESLLTFMLRDLRPKLVPIGQLPILSEVGDEALKYFDSLPEEDITEAARARKAQALRQIAQVKEDQGELATALEAAKDSLRLADELHRAHPGVTEYLVASGEAHLSVGAVLHLQGGIADATSNFGQARDALAEAAGREPLPETRALLAEAYNRIGGAAMGRGELDPTRENNEKALAIYRELLSTDSTNPEWRRAAAMSQSNIAYTQRLQGHLQDALASYRESVSVMESLVATWPDNTEWRRDLGLFTDRMGGVMLSLGLQDEALAAYQQSADTMKSLAQRDPTNADWQRGHAVALNRIASILENKQQWQDALATYRESLAIGEAVAQRDPSNAQAQVHLAWTRTNIGNVLKAQGDFPGALNELTQARAIRQSLASTSPDNRWWQSDLSQAQKAVGEILLETGHAREALDLFEQSIFVEEKLVGLDASNNFWQNALATSHLWAGRALLALDDPAATAEFTKAVDIIHPVATKTDDTTHLNTLAQALLELGRSGEAKPVVEKLEDRGFKDEELQRLKRLRTIE